MSNNSLESNILKSVEIRLGQYFQSVIKELDSNGKPKQLLSSLITSNDKYYVMEFLRKQKEDNAPNLPYLGYSLESLSIDRQGTARNVGAHYRMGEHVRSSEDNLFTVINSIPVEFNCNLSFITDDFWQSLSFSAKLLLATVDKSKLDFISVFNGVYFSIRVVMAEDVTFPKKDNNLDMPNVYEFESQFKIHAFLTDSRDFDKLEQVMPVRKVAVTPSLVPNIYEGLEFLNSDTLPDTFYISDGNGNYEQIILEV